MIYAVTNVFTYLLLMLPILYLNIFYRIENTSFELWYISFSSFNFPVPVLRNSFWLRLLNSIYKVFLLLEACNRVPNCGVNAWWHFNASLSLSLNVTQPALLPPPCVAPRRQPEGTRFRGGCDTGCWRRAPAEPVGKQSWRVAVLRSCRWSRAEADPAVAR